MRLTLATFWKMLWERLLLLKKKILTLDEELIKIIEKNPAQVVLLGLQTLWSKKVENALIEGGGENLRESVKAYIVNFLNPVGIKCGC
jgi:hypothetical protein